MTPVAVLIALKASSIYWEFLISFSIFFLMKEFHNFWINKFSLIFNSEESLFSFAAASAISWFLLYLSILLCTDSSLFLMHLCNSKILSCLSFCSFSMFFIKLSKIAFDWSLSSLVFLYFWFSKSRICDLLLNDVSISPDLIFVAMKSFFILSIMWR